MLGSRRGRGWVMDEHILVVTGSRHWFSPATLAVVLSDVSAENPGRPLTLFHGMCDPRHPLSLRRVPWAAALRLPPEDQRELAGADWHADREARAAGGWDIRPFPADWEHLGRKAGIIRNTDMILYAEARMRAGATAECAAFTAHCISADCRRPRPHDSHGTDHCTRLAERSGMPVRRITDYALAAGPRNQGGESRA